MKAKKELVTFTGIGGQLRYKCPDCSFDGYSPILVQKHWMSVHRETAAPQGPVLFDADDKPIMRNIDVPFDFTEV